MAISGKNIIVISSIDWEFNWQGPQEIASRFARYGNRVLFIENTGVRSPSLRDLDRVSRRFARWSSGVGREGVREVMPNLFVCSPLVAPPFGSPLRRRLNKQVFLPSIKKIASRLGMEDAVIWSFLPTDTAADLIKLLWDGSNPIIYYVAGDFDHLVSDTNKLHRSEQEILRMSSTVLTICSELSDRYRPSHRRVHTFPYGVDLFTFRHIERRGHDRAVTQIIDTGLNSDPRPIIGYVGAVSRHVNLEMLRECAERRPDLSWVFVGPKESNVSAFSDLPNVSFKGPRSHREIAGYIDQFDVCTIPYLRTTYTDTVMPVKLFEYLAMGKRIVSTDIPLVREFANRHNVLRISTNDAGDFLAKINESLNEADSDEDRARRRRVVSAYDWEESFKRLCDVTRLAA